MEVNFQMWGLVFGLGFAIIVVLGCVFLFKRANSGRTQMSDEEDREIEVTWNVDEYCEKKFGRSFDELELKELTKKWETDEQGLTNQIICIWIKKGLVQTADDMWGVESKARMAAINLQELGGVSRKVFQEYICKIDALVEPLVFDLLGEMMPRVLFSNIQEVKECGFFTPTAYRGSSDDIQAIKSLCLNKEKGYDLADYYNGDDILPWNEILAIMRDKADEEIRSGKVNYEDILQEKKEQKFKAEIKARARAASDAQQKHFEEMEKLERKRLDDQMQANRATKRQADEQLRVQQKALELQKEQQKIQEKQAQATQCLTCSKRRTCSKSRCTGYIAGNPR